MSRRKVFGWIAILAVLTLSLTLLDRDRAAGGVDCFILVDSTGDSVANDNVVTLREAVLFANGTADPVGGETDNVSCPDPGASTTDQIEFDGTVFGGFPPPVINLGSTIEFTDSGDAVSGTEDAGDLVWVDGGSNSFDCLRISNASGVIISGMAARHCQAGIHITSTAMMREGVISAGAPAAGNLVASNFVGANNTGIKLSGTGTAENVVMNNYVGFTDGDPDTPDPNGVGIHVLNSPGNTIGGTGLFRGVLPAGKPFPLSNRISGNTGPGILIEGAGASGNVIIDNAIGTSQDGGGAGNPNGGAGIQILNAADTLIGGVLGDDTNIISGNTGYGIDVCCFGANQTIIQGNFIGVNHNANVSVPNGGGVRISQAPLTLIGGSVSERNIISGNNGPGVTIEDGARSVELHNNFIGTAGFNGNTAVGNSQGVLILDASESEVVDNVISGNDGPGVSVIGANAENGVFARNLIGVGANGSTPLGNGAAGMAFYGTGPNRIGGSEQEGNTIAHNDGPGVEVVPNIPVSTRKTITWNSIHSNGDLGIDLAGSGIQGDGVTPNDPGDGDSGGNALQNYPELTAAETSGNSLVVRGTLNSAATTAFTLQFFVNSQCDPSGFGEGETPAGDTFGVVTGGDGNANFEFNVAATANLGASITAIATDPDGNTSEFSECVPVTAGVATPTPTLAPTATPTPGPSSTPGPTATATPGPTGTPGGKGLLGDTDCDEDVDTVDSLWVLRELAGLSFNAKCIAAGDVQCDGDRDSVDALGIQRHVAALPQIAQTQPCRDIGT